MLIPQQLARTYSHPSKDPWEAVQLYRESQRYPDDWGAQRVATKMGVSRGEIRAWVDGEGMPDPARAVEFADAHGWFDDGWTPTTEALARLTAITLACGSIETGTYRAIWTPSDDFVRQQLVRDLQVVGTDAQVVPREGTKPDQIHAASDGSPLGRALAVIGCPVGSKNETSVNSLPAFLEDAPLRIRMDWVTAFVRERGVEHPNKATRTIQTSRGGSYLTTLAQLVEDVTGESATASDDRVTISAEAVRALGLVQ